MTILKKTLRFCPLLVPLLLFSMTAAPLYAHWIKLDNNEIWMAESVRDDEVGLFQIEVTIRLSDGQRIDYSATDSEVLNNLTPFLYVDLDRTTVWLMWSRERSQDSGKYDIYQCELNLSGDNLNPVQVTRCDGITEIWSDLSPSGGVSPNGHHVAFTRQFFEAGVPAKRKVCYVNDFEGANDTGGWLNFEPAEIAAASSDRDCAAPIILVGAGPEGDPLLIIYKEWMMQVGLDGSRNARVGIVMRTEHGDPSPWERYRGTLLPINEPY